MPASRAQRRCTAARVAHLFGGGAVAAALASGAFAQTGESANSASGSPGEIIVTAQKRSERLIDVPAAVTAISAQDLSRTQAVKLEDFTAKVPGLNLISDRAGETQIVLRGITTGSPVSSTVATYIDDTAYGSSTTHALGGSLSPDLDPSDIERVEVLSGPQGTLYGASSLGGLIKYVTTPPNLKDYQGRIELDGSSADHGGDGYGVRGMVNIPLVSYTLAIRASGYDRRDPGFIDNVALGKNDVNRTDVYGGRAALLWKPSDRLSVDLSATIQNLKGNGSSDEDVTIVGNKLVPTEGDLKQARYTAGPLNIHYRLYSGTIDYDLDWAHIVSITSYSTLHQSETDDQTDEDGAILSGLLGVPGVGFSVGSDLSLKKITEEARLQSPTNQKLEWRLGFYFTHEKSFRAEPSTTFLIPSETPVPLPAPVFFANLADTYREFAGFGDVTYHFTPRIDLSAGVRYSSNRQHFIDESGGLATGGSTLIDSSSSDSSATFQVSPQFKIDANDMLYARVASGYRPGGPNSSTPIERAAGVPSAYKPDSLTSYEIGYKASLLDRKVTLDLSAFHIDWHDIQLETIIDGFSSDGNGGSARSDGAEATIGWAPLRGLSISGNAAYTDARLTEDAPGISGKKGDALPNVPKWGAGITADYDFALSGDVGAFVGGGAHYVGTRRSGFVTGSPATFVRPEIPSYATVDLRAGVSYRGYSLEIYAKNIGDERGFNNVSSMSYSGYTAPFTASVIQPRTIGVSLIAKF